MPLENSLIHKHKVYITSQIHDDNAASHINTSKTYTHIQRNFLFDYMLMCVYAGIFIPLKHLDTATQRSLLLAPPRRHHSSTVLYTIASSEDVPGCSSSRARVCTHRNTHAQLKMQHKRNTKTTSLRSRPYCSSLLQYPFRPDGYQLCTLKHKLLVYV